MPTEDAKKFELLNEYRRAFWADTRELHVLLTLAQSYQAIGCIDECIKLLQEAIKVEPGSPFAHALLAGGYADPRETMEATLNYTRAFQPDLKDEPYWNAGLDFLRRRSSRYPANYYFKEALAELCSRVGKHKETEEIYLELLAHEGVDPEQRLDWQWRLSEVLIEAATTPRDFPCSRSSCQNSARAMTSTTSSVSSPDITSKPDGSKPR